MTAPGRRLRGEAHASIYERFLYSDISDKAVRLLCVFDRCQNLGIAYPGRAWLAEKLGCSTDTVDRTIRELEVVGAVITTQTKRPGGGRPLSTYYVWPAVPDEDEQSRISAESQSRTGASTKPHTARRSQVVTANREQEKGKESSATTSPRPTDNPRTAAAHKLTTLAFEQPVKPVLRSGSAGAFVATLGIIDKILESGISVQSVERAIRIGVEVWTVAGLQTAIAHSNPKQRSQANRDGDNRTLEELLVTAAANDKKAAV